MTKEADMLALADRIESPPATKQFSPTEIAMIAQALRAASSPSPDTGLVEREALAEQIAQWLHDETGHPDAYPNHTWPETDRDDGQREGGFVKIVPLHAQAHFRDIVKRMLARFPALLSQRPAAAPEVKRINQLYGRPGNIIFGGKGNTIDHAPAATPAPEVGRDPATVEACAATVDQMAANIQARAQEHSHGIIRGMLEANARLVGDVATKLRALAAPAGPPAEGR